MSDETPASTVLDIDWLQRWALTTRQATLATIPDNQSTCILTTRVGLAVLERFNVSAKPRPVAVVAETDSARALHESGVPQSEWPADAWSVGIHPGQAHPGTGWNGHLVLVVRTTEAMQRASNIPRFLVDLTADQFARPHRGIVIDGPVIVGIERDRLWTPHDSLSIRLRNGAASIAYWPMSPGAPEAKAWRETPDWQTDPEWIDDIATQIIERMTAVSGG